MNLVPCICGHINDHDNEHPNGYRECLEPRCSCRIFRADNLKYLEEQYELRTRSIKFKK